MQLQIHILYTSQHAQNVCYPPYILFWLTKFILSASPNKRNFFISIPLLKALTRQIEWRKFNCFSNHLKCNLLTRSTTSVSDQYRYLYSSVPDPKSIISIQDPDPWGQIISDTDPAPDPLYGYGSKSSISGRYRSKSMFSLFKCPKERNFCAKRTFQL